MYRRNMMNNTLIRFAIAFLISLAAFNLHAFNGGGGKEFAMPKHDFANGGGDNNQPITNMDELMFRQPNPNVNVNGVGIYVYDGMFSLDALGPYQVFKTAALNTFLSPRTKAPSP